MITKLPRSTFILRGIVYFIELAATTLFRIVKKSNKLIAKFCWYNWPSDNKF